MGKFQLALTKHAAQSASGDCINIKGELPATIRIEDKTASGIIYISNSQHNFLGLDFIEPLGLLDIPLNFVGNAESKLLTQSAIKDMTEDILKRFSPVFTGNLGCCSQCEATLTHKPSTKSVSRSKRPVPYAALPPVDNELKHIEELTVGSTHWSSKESWWLNLVVCWFLNWPQCSTERSSISTSGSRRYLYHTQWRNLLCQTRSHRGRLTSRGLCNLQRTTDDKHPSWPITPPRKREELGPP